MQVKRHSLKLCMVPCSDRFHVLSGALHKSILEPILFHNSLDPPKNKKPENSKQEMFSQCSYPSPAASAVPAADSGCQHGRQGPWGACRAVTDERAVSLSWAEHLVRSHSQCFLGQMTLSLRICFPISPLCMRH